MNKSVRELGIHTFTDLQPDRAGGKAVITHQRIKDLLEETQLADELGLDVFGVGEHHRADYAVSSPAVILGAAASALKDKGDKVSLFNDKPVAGSLTMTSVKIEQA